MKTTRCVFFGAMLLVPGVLLHNHVYAGEPPVPVNEVEPAAVSTAASPKVTAIDDVRRGQRVTLRGEVVRINDEDEFTLRDETGRIRVYIGWKNDMVVDEGETVTVHGVADDDVLPGMRPEIYARRIELQNGTIVDLRTGRASRGYE